MVVTLFIFWDPSTYKLASLAPFFCSCHHHGLPTPTQVLWLQEAAQWSYEGEDNCWKNNPQNFTFSFIWSVQNPGNRIYRFDGTRIKTNNRQLYAVPELKPTQDGNSSSAASFEFWRFGKKFKKKTNRLVKKISLHQQ